MDGPQKPVELDEQARRPIQPTKIPNETSIHPQSAKILGSIPIGTRRDAMVNTKRPLNKWRMDQTVAKSSDKDTKKREEEENNKTQNNFSPVAPGTLIILWRDLEKRRQGEPFGVQCNLLTRVLPPRETK